MEQIGMLSFKEWSDTDQLDEVLSAQQRRKRAIQLKRNRAKLRRGRKRSRVRVAGSGVLKRRAVRQARRDLFKRFSKGKNPSQVNPALRRALEIKVNQKKGMLKRKVKKLMPAKRKADIARRS